jgi:hypothetical protein
MIYMICLPTWELVIVIIACLVFGMVIADIHSKD